MRIHMVRPGETLSLLAKIYEVDEKEIVKANGLIEGTPIIAGMKLGIPSQGVRMSLSRDGILAGRPARPAEIPENQETGGGRGEAAEEKAPSYPPAPMEELEPKEEMKPKVELKPKEKIQPKIELKPKEGLEKPAGKEKVPENLFSKMTKAVDEPSPMDPPAVKGGSAAWDWPYTYSEFFTPPGIHRPEPIDPPKPVRPGWMPRHTNSHRRTGRKSMHRPMDFQGSLPQPRGCSPIIRSVRTALGRPIPSARHMVQLMIDFLEWGCPSSHTASPPWLILRQMMRPPSPYGLWQGTQEKFFDLEHWAEKWEEEEEAGYK
ncbi:hypothetical protein CULT_170043 [[Clostridium] ultunense Esp]|nr:hypothetical protein CULT_170043 [[Clostridium] ultunense Esp]